MARSMINLKYSEISWPRVLTGKKVENKGTLNNALKVMKHLQIIIKKEKILHMFSFKPLFGNSSECRLCNNLNGTIAHLS